MYRYFALRLHFLRAPAQHRDDGHLCGDREDKRSLLERAKLVRAPAGAFGEDDDVEAGLDALRRFLVRSEGGLPVGTLDVDRRHRTRGAAEERHATNFLLGHEAVTVHDRR